MGTQVFDHKSTHEEVLNLMMAHSCNFSYEGPHNIRVFEFDLHCVKATIHAEALFDEDKNDEDVLRYRIQSLTLETA